jgi:hypothetical protein
MGVLRPGLPHNPLWIRNQQYFPCAFLRDDATAERDSMVRSAIRSVMRDGECFQKPSLGSRDVE